ncbi:hypothetical protein PIB30_007961 [Stylosanthes scabra]|uniref:F-box domain-containing protein n=1 Tax=Stylosanthes scabra TaxID=79078 RepID=A0ABU6T5N1_9FABA|nr:hypothetical protein [Stylosanthes scabra]
MSKTARLPPPQPCWRQSRFLVPEDLIVEILVRIPATCLIYLKRVCRSWRTLISSPEFARYQLERSIAHSDAQIAYSGDYFLQIKIGFFPLQCVLDNPSSSAKVVCVEAERHYNIVGSCNGLLCLLVRAPRSTSVMLWNPCTGFTSESLQTGALIMTCGFGYDHVNHKYKFFAAMTMRTPNSQREVVSKIFTFGMNHWKTIETSPVLFNPLDLFIVIDLRAEFVNGTLNWLIPLPNGEAVIVYLDLGMETYGELRLPERDSDDNFRIKPVIGVLRNCLSVCFDHKKTHWAVWLLNENQCWTKLALIPHYPLIVDHVFQRQCLRTLYISDDDVLLVGGQDDKLYLFYLKDGRIALPMIDSSSDDHIRLLSQGIYGRTLVVYYPSLLSPSRMV